MKCPKVCDRPFGVCNHRCSKPCHQGEDCGVCYEACEVRALRRYDFYHGATLLTNPGPMPSLPLWRSLQPALRAVH